MPLPSVFMRGKNRIRWECCEGKTESALLLTHFAEKHVSLIGDALEYSEAFFRLLRFPLFLFYIRSGRFRFAPSNTRKPENHCRQTVARCVTILGRRHSDKPCAKSWPNHWTNDNISIRLRISAFIDLYSCQFRISFAVYCPCPVYLCTPTMAPSNFSAFRSIRALAVVGLEHFANSLKRANTVKHCQNMRIFEMRGIQNICKSFLFIEKYHEVS